MVNMWTVASVGCVVYIFNYKDFAMRLFTLARKERHNFIDIYKYKKFRKL